tara:strand:+ start:1007 stop:2308 length:1302 start_codon:yes stop_codon:yes gene_type:complete
MDEIDEKIKKLVKYHGSNDYQNGIKLGNKLLASYPKNHIILNILGSMHLNNLNYNQALICFKSAIEYFPNFIEVYNNVSILYKNIGEHKKAIYFINKAIEIYFDYPISHLNKSEILKELNKPKEALSSLQTALDLNPKFTEALYNSACILDTLGEHSKAKEFYTKTINCDPYFKMAYRNFALLMIRCGKIKEAEKILSSFLKIDPKNTFALHHMSSITGQKNLVKEEQYSRDLFNNFNAKSFENNYTEKLLYRAPEKLKKMLIGNLKEVPIFENAIDLGCGSGLSGLAFREYVNFLLGIDISENMISLVKERKIYDKLILSDLSELSLLGDKSFDLIISSDVFPYKGNLEKIFSYIKTISSKKAFFIFSTEYSESLDDFKLELTGRYSHSHNYIKNLLMMNSFALLNFQTGNLRKEGSEWIKGGFYITKLNDI